MRRRRFVVALGSLGATALAGCLSSPFTGKAATLRLREADPGSLSDVAATPASDLSSSQRRLVRRAIQGGNATVHGYEPLRSVGTYVVDDGTYYRVVVEQGARERVERPVLLVEPTTNTTGAVSLRKYDGDASELIAQGMQTEPVVLHDGTTGRTELLPEPRHDRVTWKNETYDVSVERRIVSLREYAVTAEAIGDSPAAFREYLRDHGEVPTLSSGPLSEEGRDIVAQAIADEYEEEDPYSNAFEHILEVVRSGEQVDSDWPYVYLVVYDGTLYRAELEAVEWG